MRRAATPGEVDRLVGFLAPVDPDRHEAIAKMIFLEVGTCPRCGEPVRRCDPRKLVDGRLHHLDCAKVGVRRG